MNQNSLLNEQYKDYKYYKDEEDEGYFDPTCNKSNFGQYCFYSFCIKEKWISKIPEVKDESYDKCVICKKNIHDFVRFDGLDRYTRNLPEKIRVCYDCNFSNCRDKLIKYQNKKEIVHNNYIIYLNVPYNERDDAKKIVARLKKKL